MQSFRRGRDCQRRRHLLLRAKRLVSGGDVLGREAHHAGALGLASAFLEEYALGGAVAGLGQGRQRRAGGFQGLLRPEVRRKSALAERSRNVDAAS